ncbi:MAG TPA: protein kinase, partial [Ktedonobacteraceae bacterium]
LAAALHLPQTDAADQDSLTAVVQWLRTHQQWLLVLDQAQEQEVLAPLMPLPKPGHLLVVTSTRALESVAPLIELKQVPWEERTMLTQLSQVVGAALQGPEGRMPLGLEPVSIGRASTNQVILRDLSVSSRHAIIALKDQAYWVTDIGSTNGTLLNQQRLVPQVPSKLHPGDAIRFGNITCTYGVLERPSRSLASPPSSEQENTSAGASPLSPPSIERPRHDRIGQRFGNYRLSRLLGQGGFAEVYLGEHIYLDTQTAIKVLYTQLVGEDVEQFRQEARTIAHLEHPHIVRLLDFGVEGTTPYLIMSYAPNGTMRERYPKGTRLPLEQVVVYVKQISQALQYAHDRKIIHRDIKPENMLFGPEDQVVLSDFGIALVTQSSRYQTPNDMAGTIAYMAPEQIEAHPRPASDQYSLGIVIYEWLSGERPFHGSFTEIAVKQQLAAPASLCEKVSGLSSDVEQVVLTALAKDPKGRFGSIRALATALEQASQALQEGPSVQLNNMALPTPQNAPIVPDPLIQHALQSPQTELEQEQPLLKAPELLRENGEAHVEVPPQVHAVSPSHHTNEKMGPWDLGKRQLIAMVIGIVIYSVLIYFIDGSLAANYHGSYTLFDPLFPGGLYLSWGNILLGLIIVVPLFFATKFGPWVGLACFLLGALIGDYFSQAITNFPLSWYDFASLALLGFVSGLAFLRTQGRYDTRRNLATAVVTSIIGGVVYALFFMIVDLRVY